MDTDSYDTDGVSLFHVKGSNDYNTRAVQVPEVTASLNSGDCFVLLTPNTQYVWLGDGSNHKERDCAKTVAESLKGNRQVLMLKEGQEPVAFWGFIGGNGEYTKQKDMPDESHEPRLFWGSNKTGSFQLEEVFNFSQTDLTPDDVFILDTHNEVWVWVGVEANDVEKKEAFQAALDYVANAPDGRSPNTPVMRVDCGREPSLFTSHFIGWDPEFFSKDPYISRLMELSGVENATRITSVSQVSGFLDPAANKFSADELKSHVVPNGVDAANKEQYLSDAEFQTVFGVPKREFDSMAAWKKKNLKKKFGLF
jgi:villin 1/advillin